MLLDQKCDKRIGNEHKISRQKKDSQFWKAVFTVHSLHRWQNIWFYEGPVWQPKNLSPSHIHKQLVWELHYCLPWDVLLTQKDSLELGLLNSFLPSPDTILHDLQQTTLIEKRQPLNAWIVWTGDLLYSLFNKKTNISNFGVVYTHGTYPSLTSAAKRGG